MLVFKNDYVIIDAERDVREYYFPASTIREKQDILIFYFTIQCNGKIKRTELISDVVEDKNTVLDHKSGKNLKDYYIWYQAFTMLNDLWYKLPIDEDTHPIVELALDLFSEDNE